MNQTNVTSWKCPRCVVLSEFSELPFCGLDNVDFVREFSNYTNILLDLDQGNQLGYANDDAEVEADYANTSKKDPAGLEANYFKTKGLQKTFTVASECKQHTKQIRIS